jgi:hypothetical protein
MSYSGTSNAMEVSKEGPGVDKRKWLCVLVLQKVCNVILL